VSPSAENVTQPKLAKQVATWLAQALACALGGAACLATLRETAVHAAWLHGASLIALALGVHAQLRLDGIARARGAALGALLIAAFLPGAGALGVLWVALPSWRRRASSLGPKLVERALPRFSQEALAHHHPSAPIVADALSPARPLDERVAAVKALRHMEATRAVPLLRRALGDPAEDVRLLAHAILDRRERAIRMQLDQQLARLASTPAGVARMRAHAAIAQQHWELAYAGFLSGDGARQALERAAEHALEAGRAGDPAALLLAVRAFLRLGQADPARATLTEAAARGLDEARIAPLQAELAFLERRFTQVDTWLAALSPITAQRPQLAEVKRFWSAREAATREQAS